MIADAELVCLELEVGDAVLDVGSNVFSGRDAEFEGDGDAVVRSSARLEVDSTELVVDGTELELDSPRFELDCVKAEPRDNDAETKGGVMFIKAGSVKLVVRSVGPK